MNENNNSEAIPTLEQVQSLVKVGSYDEAATLCERICAEPDADARVWHILGAIHGQNNNVVQAELCTRQALAIDPALGAAHHNLAILLQRQGKPEEAEQCLLQALRTRPADAVLYYELGNIFRAAGKYNKAVLAYRQAIKLAPAYRDAHFNLGQTFLDMKDRHSALGCMRAAYACDGSFVKAKAIEAIILEMQGDIEAAWRCLEPWSNRETVEPVFADAFASVSRHIGREQQAIDFLTRVIEKDDTPAGELSGLYFRLGHLQERLQQYAAAFRSYTQANRLSDAPDNAERFIRSMRTARQGFTKAVMASNSPSGVKGEALVYIVGMPRSGTSLVEQILSAHSQLVAGGELAYLAVLAQDVMADLSAPNEHPGGLDPQAIEHYARRHMDIMQANFGLAKRITDKTPHNFKYLGLIHMLFPKAHIIHCRRHPLDTCTSCYSNNFDGKELAYSNDLASLGAVYREYEQLMDYWKDELYIPILDVPYEALVDDTELWARRIVEYCGLEWEAQCLEFYKQDRHVHTASYNQVRQPVYRSSVNRWRHFDKQLEPLKQILGEAAIKYHP